MHTAAIKAKANSFLKAELITFQTVKLDPPPFLLCLKSFAINTLKLRSPTQKKNTHTAKRLAVCVGDVGSSLGLTLIGLNGERGYAKDR